MKLYVLDHNSVLQDIKKEFEIVKNIDDADVVVLWNDVNPIERGIIRLAHSQGKKVIVVQHGRRGTSKYYAPFNEKITADKLLVWGEFDRTSLLEAGQENRKIKVVGAPVFSHLQKKKGHKGINIVFSPEHWDKPIEENTKVYKELKKLKGVNLITKTIDSPSHDGQDFGNSVRTDRNSDSHLKTCCELLGVCDLVVGISESTFELLAQAMDIPVVIVDEWEPKSFGGDTRYTTYRRVVSRAVKRTSVKNLRKTIGQQLANPNELKQQRLEVAFEEGGLGLNTLELIKNEIRFIGKKK